jgi:hypothetical protein
MVRRRPGTASKASSRQTGPRRRQPENREARGSSFRVLLRTALPVSIHRFFRIGWHNRRDRCKIEFTFGEIRNGKRRNFNVDTKGNLVPWEEDFEGIREAPGPPSRKRRKEDVCIDCGLQ